MTIPFRQCSVVAIDPTPRGIAYVFFEDGEFQHAGERTASAEDRAILAELDDILDGCAADVLVVEDADAPGSRRRPRLRHLLRVITKHARKRGFAVLSIARSDVLKAWRDHGVETKEAMAAEIAKRLPDLDPFVPPPRKYPSNEDRRVNLFDAASLALFAFDLPPSPPDDLALL